MNFEEFAEIIWQYYRKNIPKENISERWLLTRSAAFAYINYMQNRKIKFTYDRDTIMGISVIKLIEFYNMLTFE